MLIDDLKIIVDRNKEMNSLYLRNLLKEVLQIYTLNFVYTSVYADKFLFKGGTCLRFCFDLPRLSEDLDFDIKDFSNFSLERFSRDIKDYSYEMGEGLRINWEEFTLTDVKEFESYVNLSKSLKMEKILKEVKKIKNAD